MTSSERARTCAPDGSRSWPWAIALGLALVVLVNVLFAYIAISGSDGIVESYQTEQR